MLDSLGVAKRDDSRNATEQTFGKSRERGGRRKVWQSTIMLSKNQKMSYCWAQKDEGIEIKKRRNPSNSYCNLSWNAKRLSQGVDRWKNSVFHNLTGLTFEMIRRDIIVLSFKHRSKCWETKHYLAIIHVPVGPIYLRFTWICTRVIDFYFFVYMFIGKFVYTSYIPATCHDGDLIQNPIAFSASIQSNAVVSQHKDTCLTRLLIQLHEM